VVEGLATLLRRVDGDLETLPHLVLAHEFPEMRRTKGCLGGVFVGQDLRGRDLRAIHLVAVASQRTGRSAGEIVCFK
jgi:hypothetical protein